MLVALREKVITVSPFIEKFHTLFENRFSVNAYSVLFCP
jgi:hypothetical protein